MADSFFLPARDGGAREHEGFVAAAAAAGRIAVLVVPSDDPDLEDVRRRLLAATHGAPVLLTSRDRRRRHALRPRTPYVVASRPVPDGLVDEVEALAPDAEGVVLFSYKSHRLGAALARHLGLPMVLRAHNREGAYHRALADGVSGPRRLLLCWEASRVDRDERVLERDPVVVGIADISAVDAAARRYATNTPVRHVPPFARPTAPPAPRRPQAGRVLFLGTLSVATNVAALGWLLDDVWPAVRSSRPDAELEVVGRDPSPELAARVRATPGAVLRTDVPEIGVHLAAAAVAVAPTVSGSGVNIKVIDYLQASVPVVTTTAAAASLGMDDGHGLRVADDPESFARAIVGLLDEPDAAEQLGAEGRAVLEALADPIQGLRTIDELLVGGAE